MITQPFKELWALGYHETLIMSIVFGTVALRPPTSYNLDMQNVQAAINKRIFRILVATTAVVLFGGVLFYHHFEKLSWINAYYFCVVTLSTVGYGDIVPHTAVGKIFTTFYIMIGVGILGAFLNAIIRRRSEKMQAKQQAKITAQSNKAD